MEHNGTKPFQPPLLLSTMGCNAVADAAVSVNVMDPACMDVGIQGMHWLRQVPSTPARFSSLESPSKSSSVINFVRCYLSSVTVYRIRPLHIVYLG